MITYLFEFNKNDNFVKSRIHIEILLLISENNKSEYEQILFMYFNERREK